MKFANPLFLVFTMLVPFAALWWTFLRARREKALSRLTLKVPSSPAAGVQTALIVAGLALSLFAASRPQWGR
jgi:Kef-type K+ transport system membrane component KefB